MIRLGYKGQVQGALLILLYRQMLELHSFY